MLKLTTAILAYSMSGAATAALLGSCKADRSDAWRAAALNSSELNLISCIAERIIPTTDTPGASEAMVDRYIDMALKNNYSEGDRNKFVKSLQLFDSKAKSKFNRLFVSCNFNEQDQVLQELVHEKAAIFFEIKSLTVSGFFTSEVGVTQVFNYDPIPGEYISCMDLSTIGVRWSY